MNLLKWWFLETFSRKIAFMLPRSVIMWAAIRIFTDKPEPDAGTIEQKPIDAIDAWARYWRLY